MIYLIFYLMTSSQFVSFEFQIHIYSFLFYNLFGFIYNQKK